MSEPVDFADVQGLVRFGHGQLGVACFLLMRVTDAAAARAWIARAPVTSAVAVKPLPTTALQVAFTSEGLLALGVDPGIVADFSPEFVVGLGDDAARSRRLGDVGVNDPSTWRWGAGARVPHAAVLVYGNTATFDGWLADVRAGCARGFDEIACLDTADFGGVEPFGFADGVSQPTIDWERAIPAKDTTHLDYGDRSCLGEFVLGYPDEYGGYADRPLVDAARDADSLLPRADDDATKADVGRNGSYLVLRQLRQDVHGFWRFLDAQAAGDAARRVRLGEAMVGRTLDGRSLVGETGESVDGNEHPASGPDRNAFTYSSDPGGRHCPLGAHVRRANPRNADLPPDTSGLLERLTRMLGFDAAARAEDLVSSTRFHRLLRRGREYGARLSIAEALDGTESTPAAIVESGLHFVCLGANIARQFEFVQGAWLTAPKFDGLANERDPLTGHRGPAPDGSPTAVFSMQRSDGPDARLTGLPTFVTVVGGAYFLMPGLRALQYIARSPHRTQGAS